MEMPSRSRVVGVATVAVPATAGIVVFRSGSVQVPALPARAFAEQLPARPGALTIHVAGEVAQPGLVQVSEGARVADALSAAGEAKAGADLGSLNLASRLRDGDRVVVPPLSGGVPGLAEGVTADGRVRVSGATAEELRKLPGVGPVLAQRIAAFREAHGPFAEVEGLLDVPGIGEAKLAELRDAVTPRSFRGKAGPCSERTDFCGRESTTVALSRATRGIRSGSAGTLRQPPSCRTGRKLSGPGASRNAVVIDPRAADLDGHAEGVAPK